MNKNFVWTFMNNIWEKITPPSDTSTNTSQILLANNNTIQEIKQFHNLIQLVHLHEASILHFLLTRYEHDIIYTFTGDILIAINPFKYITNLYSPETIQHYKQTSIKQHSPHIFTIAKQSYLQLTENQLNQSILISGESGSGKTVTTKFIMKYLTSEDQEVNLIEDKILSSNVILEAFGNAKTLRNDNSSRFGKFIKLFYNETKTNIIGGAIETYLLEQVRIVNHHKQERNYHIFYMLLKSLPIEIKQKLHIKDFENYDIVNNQYVSRDVDDSKEFAEFKEKMKLFFTDVEIIDIYKLLSVVLLFGNCKVQENLNTQSIEFKNPTEVSEICELLEISQKQLIELIYHRTMTTNQKETYQIQIYL